MWNMTLATLLDKAQYLTDQNGQQTAIVFDLLTWQSLLSYLQHDNLLNTNGKNHRPQFGSARGMVIMADDFDEPLEAFAEYMP